MSHFLWGGVDCVELARNFGTPLYVMDESLIRARCVEIRSDFLNRWPNTSACYAGKAFLTTAMARIVEQEGLGLDVVSGGELHVALAAGFPPSRIELHGNAKTERELRAALDYGVGRIVVDGRMELEVLAEMAQETGKRADILLRVSPGVNPHTHAHITTGHKGSKFGLPVEGELLTKAVEYALSRKEFSLRGFHFHIGSQIFDNEAHLESVLRIVGLMDVLKERFGFETKELNFGGGFGVGKLPESLGCPHVPLRLFTDAMMEALERECTMRKLTRPAVAIEPGRWIAAEAGITLYTVTTVKRLENVIYVGVDGGMADNPRPSLYQAEYSGILANKADLPPSEKVAVVGKCCETGDILIDAVDLPAVERGDILAIFNTGAYNFSMASNYNRLPRPGVALVNAGQTDLIVTRQTYEEMLLGDRIPERLRTELPAL